MYRASRTSVSMRSGGFLSYGCRLAPPPPTHPPPQKKKYPKPQNIVKVLSGKIWRGLKSERDIGRKVMSSNVKTAFRCTPASCVRGEELRARSPQRSVLALFYRAGPANPFCRLGRCVRIVSGWAYISL